MTAPFTRDVLNTIIRNAGRMPAAQIARDCGISLSFLETKAREQGIDLRVDGPLPTPSAQLSAAGHPAARAAPRYGNITVNLPHADYETMVAKAQEHNLRRATLFAALVRGALASGQFDALVTLGRRGIGL